MSSTPRRRRRPSSRRLSQGAVCRPRPGGCSGWRSYPRRWRKRSMSHRSTRARGWRRRAPPRHRRSPPASHLRQTDLSQGRYSCRPACAQRRPRPRPHRREARGESRPRPPRRRSPRRHSRFGSSPAGHPPCPRVRPQYPAQRRRRLPPVRARQRRRTPRTAERARRGICKVIFS